ncbi:MAG: ABC-type Mn2+/Zn2+ transport system ATPase subunit [Gammaproteobacteria bacterium]|jgi:ABC-type Mn2+/Zn2+ transport system ATPase subunit
MTLLLEAKNYSFGYDGVPVVSGTHLTIEAGQLVGIVGPNGSGKSTLFRGLLGLIPPMSGQVMRETEAVAYVPQKEVLDGLYPLSAGEVVQMGAFGHLTGLRRVRAEDRTRAGECLAQVGLPDVGRHAYASLSGGQRQRVLLARALMARPRLLMLDEPTSGVDTSAAGIIMELILRLAHEQGLAIAMVSHHLEELRQVASIGVRVDDGQVRVGSPDELLIEERSLSTASASTKK